MNKFISKISDQLAKNIASVLTVLVVIIIILELLNPFNFSFVNSVRDFLGLDRDSVAKLEEIVEGKLEGRRLLSDATREYSSSFVLEKEGGLFNCAGEELRINDALATARVVVPSDGLEFSEKDGVKTVSVPQATLDSVDLSEDIEIINKRNLCVRLTQLFGDISSESEARELLRLEVERAAEDDEELFAQATCSAVEELRSLLSNTDFTDSEVRYTSGQVEVSGC